jgi:hypothetical protein
VIPPTQQWCIQIDVTNVCSRACSNCTRLLSHVKTPFFMNVETFSHAVSSLKGFLTESETDNGQLPWLPLREKVIGIIGGEPLLHPQFQHLAEIMLELIPRKSQRGLWTSLDWKKTKNSELIEKTFGYINENRHEPPSVHSPVLVAINEVVEDKSKQKKLIDNCWLQRNWSSSITPKGFFFCEVAGSMDLVFDGPGGLPVDKDCWKRPLSDFKEQINHWCPHCGIPLQIAGRKDIENTDDISPKNLELLKGVGSPRVKNGGYVVFDANKEHSVTNAPWLYRTDK